MNLRFFQILMCVLVAGALPQMPSEKKEELKKAANKYADAVFDTKLHQNERLLRVTTSFSGRVPWFL